MQHSMTKRTLRHAHHILAASNAGAATPRPLRRRALDWIFLALLLTCVAPVAKGQPQLFWTDANAYTVEGARADGSDRQILSLFVDGASQIATDPAGEKVYWTDLAFSAGTETARRLRRANLDGSEAETLVLDLLEPEGLAVDPQGGRVYWSEPEAHRIRSAKLDGTDARIFVDESDGAESPGALAFDSDNGLLFWIDSGSDMIRSAPADGSEITDVVESAGLFGLALDPVNGLVYWTVYRDAEILRAGYDGSAPEVVIETGDRPQRLALDADGGRIYWSSVAFSGDGIHGANIDGSDRVDYLEADEVRDIYVDAERSQLLWTGDGEASGSGIGIVRPASRETEVLFPGGSPRDVEADASAGYVFWNEGNAVVRARFDGSEKTTIHEAAFAPQGIDLDRKSQNVYFSSGGDVHRMDYAGESIEQLTDRTTAGLGDIAVDSDNGYVYWVGNASGTFGFIERSDLDGGDRQEILSGLNYPRALRANPKDATLYWAFGGATDADPAGIRSAGADGAGVLDVIATSGTPRDIAIDFENGQLYWTDSELKRIERSALDGSGVVTVVSARLEEPSALSVVPFVSTRRETPHPLASSVTLQAAYPNPFNPATTIAFELPLESRVHLAVYDILGRQIRVLVNGRRPAGSHAVSLEAHDLPSGTYIYRLDVAGKTQTRTLTLAK